MRKLSREQFREALTGPFSSHAVFFNKDGSLDYKGTRNAIDFVIAAGSGTIMLTYGDGLYSILTDQEVAEVTRVVVEHTAGRAMVIAADRQWPTGKAVEFAGYCRDIGADMLMVSPPNWGDSCTFETLVEHYTAAAGQMPLMVVTAAFAPIRATGLKVLEALRDRLPGVLAVKDDLCGDFGRKLGLMMHEKCPVVSGGQKQNHLDIHLYGCDGYLSTFIDFKPEIAQKYWAAIKTGDLAAARGVIARYDMPFFDFIGTVPGNFDAGVHGTMELFGVAQRWRRKPYYSLNDADMEKLADFYRKLGIR